jgi:hypothetical protein
LLLLALLSAWTLGASASELAASLDRTRIVLGETVLLTLSAPGDSWGIPELDPLEGDFDVESRGQSTNMTIINGQASSTREWRFLLAPKRTGTLTIPALDIGDLRSEPIRLEVLPASAAGEVGRTLPVLVEVEVDEETPYVQGQVIYTARVLARVQVHQATLEDPVADGVIIERLGEDRSYETSREGRRYRVIERRYALFPQRSGSVEIAPPVLSGGIAEASRGTGGGQSPGRTPRSAFERFFGRDPFEDMDGLLQRTRPIKVRGPALTLEVRPQPAGSPVPWLPAQSLQLSDTWTPDLSELRVGEPVTRTIAITAQGLTAAQLPDLIPDVPDGVKLYPDKPRSETRAEGGDLVAVKEIKHALVPSVAGELTLPEVRLAWWDTQEERERVAVLPARVVRVLPARSPAAVDTAPPTPAPEPANGEGPAPTQDALPLSALIPDQEPVVMEGTAADVTRSGFPLPAGYWPWLGAVLGLLWLLTLLLWLRERRRRNGMLQARRAQRERHPAPSLSSARSRVRRACEANDPRAARDALLAWAALCWRGRAPMRLESLADRLGGPAGETLHALDRSLYAPQSGTWDGRAAWDSLRPALMGAETAGHESRQEAASLPPLYPTNA